MKELVAIFAAVDAEVPQNLTELYFAQIAAMLVFAVIAWVTGLFYTGRVDVYRIVRNGLNGGVAFPPSLLLVLYPVSPRARALFGEEQLRGYLMFAGATIAVHLVYGLFKR